MLNKIVESLKIYKDKRMAVMLAFGFASGFPFPLVFNTLSLWLESSGLSLALIGLFSIAKMPYSFKWVWAPFVDNIKIPFLSKMGRRRSWALVTQIILAIAIISMSRTNPAEMPYLILILAAILAIASSSQDIVLDAYRIEQFNKSEQAAGSATFVMGYRLGMIFSGAIALYLASVMSWGNVFLIMSIGSLVGIITVLLIKEPSQVSSTDNDHLSYTQKVKAFYETAVRAPILDFIKRPHWITILLFIFLYRMSDAYISPMAYLFYVNMDFDYIQIANITKIYGTIATIGGMFLGGALLNRISMNKGLMICGIFQCISNLIYVAQAYAPGNIYMLILTITIENISGGMGTAAFVAYISSLCNTAYTATQYALLSSLMSFARDIVATSSGALASAVGWKMFFFITTLMGIPGLLVLSYLIYLRKVDIKSQYNLPK